MNKDSEINVLLSNIIEEKHCSHCRLCLARISSGNYAKFEDCIDYGSEKLCSLSVIIEKIFDTQISQVIAGMDAVCTECLDKAVEAYKFILSCEKSTRRLNTILDTLTDTLSNDIDISDKKNLYIMCTEQNSQLIFEKKLKPRKNKAKCCICKEIFSDSEKMKEHSLNVHGLHTCNKCQLMGNNKAFIVEHESSPDMYECASCPIIRCTEDSMKDHENRVHGTHVCKDCGKSFTGLDKLMTHEKKHSIKNQCPKCGKIYSTVEFFHKHVKLCLEGKVKRHPMRSELNQSYPCQECGKVYSTPGGLKVHQKFVHGNAKPHVCEQCGKKFTAPSYLRAHLITHTGLKNFKCNICNGHYVTKEALLYHTRRHTGEKPYSCKLCGEKFVNSSARADHMKHKHIGPTLECALCPRKFVTKNFLKIHMKRHYNPTNKLYIGRQSIPPNVPGRQNMRCPKEEMEDEEYII